MTFQNMLRLLLFVNKSTIVYKKILVWEDCQIFNNGKYIAEYSIMVSTLGVVGEHFSVAQPSHGQVGFIPGVVKLSQGDLVSLDLVFPFQVIITAHWPCTSMPSPCKSGTSMEPLGSGIHIPRSFQTPAEWHLSGFDKLLACRGPLISSRTWFIMFMRSGWTQKSSWVEFWMMLH